MLGIYTAVKITSDTEGSGDYSVLTEVPSVPSCMFDASYLTAPRTPPKPLLYHLSPGIPQQGSPVALMTSAGNLPL